ncbi:autophagy protein 12-like [Ischnura elegans]|uniref:autophagy protein 12-like n=1 Tax=Ischnura elegans TaxID=197161 RepID=UPI001ED886AC|nr:autophagy protein 12-like [Ischnura elegans]XP_046394288.1 autophagy protein 12-like [Ischnura elegans]XP_046394298.1 autophagy protein 12-like [Ischnura elegans]XP_046394304.1 autophagy protein 12-like [Ischnura elegans]XP_046394312.1 autophagy protein 12-like [Ischnura elegans]XP_046394319.1 autophagy protein 12-like [Ischnura elegans]XP_046394327.1 autophagy protein 12-like [Ischnura elegans]
MMAENPVEGKTNESDVPEGNSQVGSKTDCGINVKADSEKLKIDILLKATANAPIMKTKKWAVDPDKRIGWIMEFIKKYLKLDPSESLYLYVNQAFAPSPDQVVRNLYECFGTDGKLVLHYCKSQAWG